MTLRQCVLPVGKYQQKLLVLSIANRPVMDLAKLTMMMNRESITLRDVRNMNRLETHII